jgi:hypothetical protein
MRTKEDFMEAFRYEGGELEFEGVTPQNVEEAFEMSIAKWMLLRDYPEISLTNGRLTCGLCLLFNTDALRDENLECYGCPIRDHTNIRHCGNTPYEEYDFLEDYSETDIPDVESRKEIIINEEIQFLEMLYAKWKQDHQGE